MPALRLTKITRGVGLKLLYFFEERSLLFPETSLRKFAKFREERCPYSTDLKKITTLMYTISTRIWMIMQMLLSILSDLAFSIVQCSGLITCCPVHAIRWLFWQHFELFFFRTPNFFGKKLKKMEMVLILHVVLIRHTVLKSVPKTAKQERSFVSKSRGR